MTTQSMRREASVLVLVDYQSKLMPAIHAAPDVVREAVFLANCAKLLGIPVLGTEQNPSGLGNNEPAVADVCDAMLSKMHFDACQDGLSELILQHRPAARQVVIAGCETHVCLLQTALGLLREGFTVFVVSAACGSRTPADKALGLQRLQQAGATLVSPEMLAFEWVDDCRHPQFKQVLGLIKQRPLNG